MEIIIAAIIGGLFSATLYHSIRYSYDTKAIKRAKLEELYDVIANYHNWNGQLVKEVAAGKFTDKLNISSPGYKVEAIINVYLPELADELRGFAESNRKFNAWLVSVDESRATEIALSNKQKKAIVKSLGEVECKVNKSIDALKLAVEKLAIELQPS